MVIHFYFQGEPLLCKDLPAMIAKAHQQGIYTIVSTNAQNLTEKLATQLLQAGLDRIIISMDGLTQLTYEKYRVGGKIEKVLKALQVLKQLKKSLHSRIHIELQCLLLRSNEHEWKQLKHSYRHLGADSLTFKTAQFYDYKNGDSLMPTDHKYSRYKMSNNGKYELKHKPKKICSRLFFGCVMDVMGHILPCCFDKNKQFTFGSITDSSFDEIWQSKKACMFRQNVLSDRSHFAICTNCTE